MNKVIILFGVRLVTFLKLK